MHVGVAKKKCQNVKYSRYKSSHRGFSSIPRYARSGMARSCLGPNLIQAASSPCGPSALEPSGCPSNPHLWPVCRICSVLRVWTYACWPSAPSARLSARPSARPTARDAAPPRLLARTHSVHRVSRTGAFPGLRAKRESEGPTIGGSQGMNGKGQRKDTCRKRGGKTRTILDGIRHTT